MNRRTLWTLAAAVVVVALTWGCAGPSGEVASDADPSPEALLEKARAVHERVLVLDAHADTELPDAPSPYVGDDGLSQVDPAKLHEGGVDAVVMSVAVGSGPRTPEGYAAARSRADEEVAAVLELAADPANNAVVARSADEIVAAHEQGKAALILGFQNGMILGTDVSALDDFYVAGARVFALTHLGNNDFADSSRPVFDAETGTHEPPEHGGLSDLGVAAIQRINALGGVVDVSQLSRDAVLQVLETSTAPVIATHSNVRQLTEATRNLTDEEIDGIGAIGGVIHLCPFRGYLFDSADQALDQAIREARRAAGVLEDYLYPFELYWEIDEPEARSAFTQSISNLLGPGSVDSMLDHLDYIVDRIGVDHVGIGSDFNHGGGVEGFADASEALGVTVGLLKRGYSEEDIAKIWGGNFLRVLRAAEAGGTSGE